MLIPASQNKEDSGQLKYGSVVVDAVRKDQKQGSSGDLGKRSPGLSLQARP